MNSFRDVLLSTLLVIAPAVRAELPVKKVLTLNVAKKIAAAAEAEANRRHLTAVIVVVDDGGHLLGLQRLDNTQVAIVEVGIGKSPDSRYLPAPQQGFRGPGSRGAGCSPGAAGSDASARRHSN